MTVGELLKMLRAMPPNADVTINGMNPVSIAHDVEDNLVDIVPEDEDDAYFVDEIDEGEVF